jgi:hypothetical protein
MQHGCEEPDATEKRAIELHRSLEARLVPWVTPPEYASNLGNELESLNQLANTRERTVITGRFRWAKRILARFFRPFHECQSEFNRQIVNQISDLHMLVSALQSGRSELLAAVSAGAREGLDRLRTELLLEVHSMGKSPLRGVLEDAHYHKLICSMGNLLRLHVGAALGRRDGFLNVDEVPGSDVDVLSPLDQLPVRPETVAELVATHVVERYPVHVVTQRLLPHWVSLLRPGGRLVVVTTDMEAAVEGLRDGLLRLDQFVSCLFGAQAQPHDSHRSAFTPDLLSEYAKESGLSHLAITWRRQEAGTPRFAFELEGYKSAA